MDNETIYEITTKMNPAFKYMVGRWVVYNRLNDSVALARVNDNGEKMDWRRNNNTMFLSAEQFQEIINAN